MRSIFFAFALSVSVAGRAGAVAISATNGLTTVLTPLYELTLCPDGYPGSLRVLKPGEGVANIPNMLDAGSANPKNLLLGQTRGAYFFQDGLVPLDALRPGDHTLIAQGEKASIQYRFKPSEIDLALTNKTTGPMQFFWLLDRSVHGVAGPRNHIERTPALALWNSPTFYQGSRKLHITGADRIWGPDQSLGESNPEGWVQIVEVTLSPNEKRLLTVVPSVASADETATVASLAPAPPYYSNPLNPSLSLQPSVDGTVRIFSPREYQVFQRNTRTDGEILLTGDAPPNTTQIQYRITGPSLSGSLAGDWHALAVDPVTHAFSALVRCPAGGWYRVDLRAGNTSVTVAHVGVGEVFIAAGESNSSNTGSEPTRSVSGMVSTFGGADWRLADDPQPGAYDNTAGGSPWPAFGDALYAKLHVPIAIAVTGRAGSSLRQWRSGFPCFMWMMARMLELHRGGFRGILWQQGQSDVNCSGPDYFNAMSDLIASSKSAAGWSFPWYVAQSSACGPAAPASPTLREAQQLLCTRGIALPGADTDSIGARDRAGIDFNAAGLKRDGELWAAAVLNSLPR